MTRDEQRERQTHDFPQPCLCCPPAKARVETCDGGHTPCPAGYLAWHEWAKHMSKTHAAVRCQKCTLWAIWLPKAEARRINRERAAENKRVVPALVKAMEAMADAALAAKEQTDATQ